MKPVYEKTPRIEVVDALRGFAVMAIILVHCIEHFHYMYYPTDSPSWLNALDRGVGNTVFCLFAGKAYAIFALLFGFTFYIQTNNQKKKGKDFGYRFLWRMVLLVGFASLNALFYPAGDVLLLFSIVSLVLFLTRNWSDKAIIILSIFFLLQPVEWFHYIAKLINPTHQIPDLKVNEMFRFVAEYTKSGDLWYFLSNNVTLGQKASLFWAIGAGRFIQTAGLFLLGFYLGRKQLFIFSEKSNRFWITTLVVSSVAFAPLYTIMELVMGSSDFTQKTVGTVLDMWQKLAFTLVLISSFVLLYQNDKFKKAVTNLRYYGKMSLTNYISQSIIGGLVFFPFGLHLAPHCGYTMSLIVALLILTVQVRICKWWLSSHKQGPLEYIWHKWTWLKSNK